MPATINATVGRRLVTGACTQASPLRTPTPMSERTRRFAHKIDVIIANTTTGATDKCVFPTQAAACPAISNTNNLSTLASQSFGAVPLTVIAPAASATYVVTAELDSGVATNADQGLAATVPFTWSISQ